MVQGAFHKNYSLVTGKNIKKIRMISRTQIGMRDHSFTLRQVQVLLCVTGEQ